jgi:GntR family histidine utilization transcriptional repressor
MRALHARSKIAPNARRLRAAARSKTTESSSLYRRIRRDIEQRILTGEWPPGHRIPAEHELMRQYDCARMTVHRALTELAETALIERRKRAGSFVRRPKMLSAVLEIADIRAEIASLGRKYDYHLLSRRQRAATRADCARMDVTSARSVLVLESRHAADGVPFALEDRLINLDAIPSAAGVDFSTEPPGTWLIAHIPWSEAEHRISATGADAKTAAALGLAVGTACLVVERRTWRAGRTLTAVRLVYPGNAHQLIARFDPRSTATTRREQP